MRCALLLSSILLAGCQIGFGANGAHRGTITADSAAEWSASGDQSGVPAGFVRVVQVGSTPAFMQSLGLGLHSGVKMGWTRGSATGRPSATGYAGEQHI